MSDGHFQLGLISFRLCGVTESGGRGLAVAPSAFVAMSMVVSTPLVVLAACMVGLVITWSTVVLVLPTPLSFFGVWKGFCRESGGRV